MGTVLPTTGGPAATEAPAAARDAPAPAIAAPSPAPAAAAAAPGRSGDEDRASGTATRARGIKDAAPDAVGDPQPDREPENHQEPVDDGIVGVTARLAALLHLGGIAGEHENDVADPVLDAAAKVAFAKTRQDSVFDDDLGQRIGEGALEPAADLAPHFALIRRDDKDDAIVESLGADAPVTPELIAEILDGVALQRRQGDDHELIGALILECLEVGGDRHLLREGQEASVDLKALEDK